MVTVVAFGVAPALQTCRGCGASAGFAWACAVVEPAVSGARSALVVAEVVASVVLLVSSGLLIRALWRVQSVDPGFITSGILSLRTELPFPKYNKTSTRDQFYGKVLTDVRRLPGVTDAAYITALPMTWGGGIWPVEVNGRSQIRTEGTSASLRFVTPGLFSTLGIPINWVEA